MQPSGGETVRGRTLAGLLIAVAALLAAGCAPASTGGEPAPTGQPSLPGTGWVLSAFGAPGNMELSLRDHLPTLWFADGELRGSAGCNTYTGSYTATPEGELSISGLANTEMYCTDEGVMDQEEAFLETLRLAETYELDDRTLTITGGDRMLIFINNCLCSDEAQLTDEG
jgi:heat shock protein HslJ